MTSQCSKLKWDHEPQVMVWLERFENFDVIAITDKRIDHGEFSVDLSFTMVLTVFDVHFRRNYSENRPRKIEKNKLRHHRVIFIVCCLIDHSSRPFNTQEIIISSAITTYHHIIFTFFLFTDQVTLLFVGDITFSGPVRYYVEHHHQSYNTCFVEVASFIRGADISVANLETPFVNASLFSHKCQKQVVLDSSPQSASSLRWILPWSSTHCRCSISVKIPNTIKTD